ncbi:MAG: efflux RND transporter periplasmic adaptor subunit [Candidatus Omnitrophica bacterium]|nr:efflux RND transporter periplasmic adaptor subunit [Candidatus Omnitrophota bacterium]
MKNKNIVLLTALLVFSAVIGLGLSLFFWPHHPAEKISASQGQHDFWYCPMHPWIKSDKPGACPICGMTLVPGHHHSQGQVKSVSDIQGYAPIEISSQKQQLIGLRTQVVAVKPIVKWVRTFGTIASDAELYKIQGEFIDDYVQYAKVVRNYKNIRNHRYMWEDYRDLQTRLLEAKDKLLKLGLSDEEIKKLENVTWNMMWIKEPELSMFNDKRSYWIMTQIFEQDFAYVHKGQEAQVSFPSYPGESIKGVVRSVGGWIDPSSRSLTALVEIINDKVPLAANMQADVRIFVTLGKALLVPREAVMDTGVRKIVFVQKAQGSFEPREIQTGVETDDGYEVTSGLKAGERIVTSGNFLLDSESRIQDALQGGGHSHGS